MFGGDGWEATHSLTDRGVGGHRLHAFARSRLTPVHSRYAFYTVGV